MLYALGFFVLWIVCEFLLFLIFFHISKRNKWVYFRNALIGRISLEDASAFFSKSFDALLGWTRRADSTGTDTDHLGRTFTFHIGAAGERTCESRRPAIKQLCPRTLRISTYGDSYVFGRQVPFEHTWQERIAARTGWEILNFGVGNYGADQAVLRYESHCKVPQTDLVILGFVPETIVRIQAVWKHFSELGNVLAFKPRYTGDKTTPFHPCPVGSIEDLVSYENILPTLCRDDRFYRERFLRYCMTFPYVFSLLRSRSRLVPMLLGYLENSVGRIDSAGLSDRLFKAIVDTNIRDAHRLYDEDKSRNLLRGLINHFCSVAHVRGAKPLVVIFPQLADLKTKTRSSYQRYFRSEFDDVPIVDLTDNFLQAEFTSLYINDIYGGHLNCAGNLFASNAIESSVRSVLI